MSREIKFRAWWQHPKYMPKGKMYFVAGLNNIIGHDYDEPERDVSDHPQEVFIVEKLPTVEKVNWNEAKYMRLMQYTGLKDKHGTEIYEGDIIQSETHYYGNKRVRKTVIEWQNDLEHDGFGEPLAMGYIFRGGSLEVIGNIYENPELLK